ncbi:hypothetical protein SDC9_210146 [bioreactor metagenome]|uniref:Uncharacterized protein n=1 Tax=bioreactor metagenome TaxID=1076179 RepID=A0A645JI82_9ZZZZ
MEQLLVDTSEHRIGPFSDLRVVPFITAEHNGARTIEDHPFDGGRADVQADAEFG